MVDVQNEISVILIYLVRSWNMMWISRAESCFGQDRLKCFQYGKKISVSKERK